MSDTTTPVQSAVAEYFNITVSDLLAGPRSAPQSTARHIARYLERTLFGKSLPEIGRLYGCDHTTVLASVNHITDRMASRDERYFAHVERLSEILRPTIESVSKTQALKADVLMNAMRCPTCGAPVVQELRRQLEELSKRLAEIENR